jgi:uncharacterized protein (TIGR04141 family)
MSVAVASGDGSEPGLSLDSLTIYLLRAATAADCIDPEAATQACPVKHGELELGVLYVGQTNDRTPDWFAALSPFLASPPELRTRRARAVWVAPVSQGFFCITFGDGRHLLQSARIVHGFGLRCVLNLVNADSIRGLKKRTLETMAAHSRYQAIEDISIDDFSIDVERDLLRGVTGVPTDPNLFGSRFAGSDAISMNCKVEPQDVPAILAKLSAAYEDSKYKARFDWVDNIAVVQDSDEVAKLEKRVSQVLAMEDSKKKGERCFLALPDLSDCPNAVSLQVRGIKHVFDDISFTALREVLGGKCIDLAMLKSSHMVARSTEKVELDSWTLFECLNFETELSGRRYLLADGEWFRVEAKFEQSIKDALARIPISTRTFPEYDEDSEGAYTTKWAASDSDNLALMDAKFIHHGGGNSKFELCDVLTSNNEFIHIKRYEGASHAMSHLFFQGLASARLFKSSSEFRRKANKLLPAVFAFADTDKAVDVSNWEVCYAIISRHNKTPAESIAFFAQLSLNNVYRILAQELGFKVSLARISAKAKVKIKAAPPPHAS